MHILEQNLKKAEARYDAEQSGKNALALFACHVLIGKTTGTEGAHLSKAFHVAFSAHQADLLDLDVFIALLHANVLMGNYERAYELIRGTESHSSFLNKNMPEFYGRVLYFYSIVQANTDKQKIGKKLYKNIEQISEKNGIISLKECLASLQRTVFGNSAEAARIYEEAAAKGHKSFYMLLDIYEMLTEEEEYTREMNTIAKLIIPWALNKDLPIDTIIERIEKRTLIEMLFSLSTRNLSKIFEKYEHVGAFQCLCQKLIFSGDVSEKALSYYKIALKNDLRLRGLEELSLKAAYKNKYYSMPVFIIEEALATPTAFNSRELAFLFGSLISQTERSDDTEAIRRHRDNIIKFGMWALSKNLRGTDFNTVYKFMTDLFPDNDSLLEIMYDEVFKYEITFNGQIPSYVCVYEYAKPGVTAYKVNDNVCYVNSIGKFECYFLGEKEDEYLIITDYTITKRFKTETLPLLITLYTSGFNNSMVILALAAEYLKAEEEPDNFGLHILQEATILDEISEDFRLDICSALAEYYSSREQYNNALHFYLYIGETNLKPERLLGALNTYLATGRFDNAISLITKKHYAISDIAIFNALNILYDRAQTLEMASVCYNLILNDLCSTEILNIVLKKFKGTSDEWLVIANKIDSLGFDVTQLYEKIIINGIFTGNGGNDCNEAFLKLYSKDKNNSVIPKYVYFCCYEIIKNGRTVSDEFAEILEEIYFEEEDTLLCYALAVTYIRGGRQDKMPIISESAMFLEEEGIILPEFKQQQDKSFISSYIEKHTPLIKTAPPNRNIFLCYKQEDREAYEKIPMKYFRFGIYLINLALFYGERITYYFEDEHGEKTEPRVYTNNHMRIIEQYSDTFYTINNAVIYEHMMKFDKIEELIESNLERKEQFRILTI